MPVRTAKAEWKGDLKGGKGNVEFGGGAFKGQYSFTSRFEEGTGTNPEEMIGAAHAGCYSMALSAALGKAGFEPKRVATQANVYLEKVDAGFKITKIELRTEAEIPDINEKTFLEHAEAAKTGCPVSQALMGVDILLNARLL